jgi:arsenate reductase
VGAHADARVLHAARYGRVLTRARSLLHICTLQPFHLPRNGPGKHATTHSFFLHSSLALHRRRGVGKRSESRVNAVEDQLSPKTVLFVSDRNACRSQIAAALFNRLSNPRVVRALSGGIRPARQVHPQLKPAMQEIGIDLRDPIPRLLSPDRVANSHVLITFACGESCPGPESLPHDDWLLADSPGSSVEEVRDIRDEIASRVRRLVAAHPWE